MTIEAMTIELLIARWTALLWIVCGLSHLLHPRRWVELLFPLREQRTGGFVLAFLSLPFGLIMIVGHNVWVWDIPVIVTLAGWMTTLKCTTYLLLPDAHRRVMSINSRPEVAFRMGGAVMFVLGLVVGYDSFFG